MEGDVGLPEGHLDPPDTSKGHWVPAEPQSLWCHQDSRTWAIPLKVEWPSFAPQPTDWNPQWILKSMEQ